ncbi:MAG: GAF domain-containing protein [Bacteroidales bacterium]|nr:GAF domain-containing protein [Bacteroidales bacterium]
MKLIRIINSRIRYKLIVGFVFVSLFVGVVSYISLRTIREIGKDYEQISDKSLPLLQYLEDMKFNCLRLISSTSEFGYFVAENRNITVGSPAKNEKELMQQACNSCHDAFSHYELLVNESFPETIEHVKQIRKAGIVLHTSAEEFVALKENGVTGTQALVKKEEMESAEMEFLSAISSSIAHTNKRFADEKTHLGINISTSYRNILLLSGLTIVIGLLIGLLISRSISKPITKLTQLADNFQNGNFDAVTDIKSSDEVGVLGKSFHEMALKIKQLIAKLENEIQLSNDAHESILESEEMFRRLFDESAEPNLILDESGFTNCNDSTLTALGYSFRNELLKRQPWELSPERQPDGQLSSDKAVMMINTAIAEGYHRFEWIHSKSDGSDFPVEVMLTPIQLKGKQVLYTVWRDITSRLEMEKLRNSLYEISQAVHQAPDIDSLYRCIHEIVKKLMLANNFYIALYDPDTDLISFPYFIDEVDVVSDPIKPGRSCSAYVLRTGKPAIIDPELTEELNRTGEVDVVGEPLEVWLGVPLKVNDKTIGVMVVQDYHNERAYGEKEKEILMFVSEQVASAIYKKSTEEKLKEYTAELVQLNAEKDKFFSIIAHDLKSPFNSIISFSHLLDEQIRERDIAGIEKFAKIIHQSSVRGMDLLMNLMEWSRSQTGRMEFKPEDYQLTDLINQAVPIFIDIAGQKSITIDLELAPGIRVNVDNEMIATVLRNLISNAIKFTVPGGKITVSTRVTISEAVVSVSDTGVGIDPDRIDKLFRVDETSSTPGTQNEKGTGLGLILCKEFIKKNGGRIWVESERNKGSVFYFTLPLKERET